MCLPAAVSLKNLSGRLSVLSIHHLADAKAYCMCFLSHSTTRKSRGTVSFASCSLHEDDQDHVVSRGRTWRQLQLVQVHRKLAFEYKLPLIDMYSKLLDRPYDHLGDMCAEHPPRSAVNGTTKALPWQVEFSSPL